MQYSAQVKSYRESEILTAPPGRLLVITYDALIAAMTRARVGIAMANPEVATSGFSRSREIIGELLATLDREAGGDLAQRLASIYAFLLAELDSIAIRGDTMTLERCINIVGELREAFAEASATQAMAS